MAILSEGQTIRDTYTVDRFLGEGAFAEVYRVQHRFLGRQAMKVLKSPGATGEEIEDMLGEALLLSRLGHPNVIRVFDANVLDTTSGRFGFFTMECIAGGSLHGYWRSYREKFMPVPEVVDILKQVCSGIAVAHSAEVPIIHRDIKPQNILIGYDGEGMRVRVSDFGLAKRVNPLTLLASAQGTLGFKPPESFENMDSSAADVWALGTTLYLLLTDTMPFPGLDHRDLRDSQSSLKRLRPPSMHNIEVNPALDVITCRCLAREPRDRYPDAGALLEELQQWQPGRKSEHFAEPNDASTTFKPSLGRTPADRKTPAAIVEEAFALARRPGELAVAADLLEEAITKDPGLRSQYASRMKLWRRGISM